MKCNRVKANARNGIIEYSAEDEESAQRVETKSVEQHLTELVTNAATDSEYLQKLQETEKEHLQRLFEMLKTKQFDQVWAQVIKSTVHLYPAVFSSFLGGSKLMENLELNYSQLRPLFVPLLLWPSLSERNLVKALLSSTADLPGIVTTRILQAGAFFLYQHLHGRRVLIEFVLGKVLGYWACISKDQALAAFELIQTQVKTFPSLHMPEGPVDERAYFKKLVGFYAGFFSWFPVEFTAIIFKRVFVPPRRENTQTLSEKSLLSYFVDNVLVRLFKASKLSIRDIATFYRVWDQERVVLKSYNQSAGYQAVQAEEVQLLANYLKIAKERKKQSD